MPESGSSVKYADCAISGRSMAVGQIAWTALSFLEYQSPAELLDSLPRLSDYPVKPCGAGPWTWRGGFAVSALGNMRGCVSRQRDRGGSPPAPDGRGLEGDWRRDRRRQARRFLAAIAALATPRSSEARSGLRKPSPVPLAKAPEDLLERRPITVMFLRPGRIDKPGREARRRGLA